MLVTTTVAVTACAHLSGGGDPPLPSAVSGTLRFLERENADTAIGPVVVMLEPIDRSTTGGRAAELFHVTSSTDHFDPGFTAIAEGDYVVFVNEGSVSHRLFSADLGSDLQIPVGPADSSAPQRIDRAGELAFFCSLHPDENFNVLATADVFFGVVDAEGRFYVGSLPSGSYRMSIWSPRVKGTVRTVEVGSGSTLLETIWLDPDLIGS